MAKEKDWITYIDLDGEWNAESFNRMDDDDDTLEIIHAKGFRVQSFTYFQTKDEAIRYSQDICRRK